jgi:hypothetical protein
MAGRGGAVSQKEEKLSQIQLTASTFGVPVTLAYGLNRVSLALLQYEDFTATEHTSKTGGGKGGGGAPKNTSFTYSAAVVMMVCEGPSIGISIVYQDKSQMTVGSLGFTLFDGALNQATWSYLTTNHPTRAIAYPSTAILVHGALELGSGASMPQISCEVIGIGSSGPIGGDAHPDDILNDYCTHAVHGCNFPYLDATTLNTFGEYCTAMGFNLSPVEKAQRPAKEFIDEILRICNSFAVKSGAVLKIIPYADESVTGNGSTYTADLTPIFSLTDDDYCPSEGVDPVRLIRKASNDTYNVVRVEFNDREHQYNPTIAESKDESDVAQRGERVMDTISFHAITTKECARLVGQIINQRQLYIRNTYEFELRPDFCLLEPGDFLALNDSALGLSSALVRITEIREDSEEEALRLSITAEEVLVGTAGAPLYDWQSAQGYAANYADDPGNVLAPQIFSAPALLIGPAGGHEIWIAVCGATGAPWGGCVVHMSLDNARYEAVGRIMGSARYGTLTATLPTGSDPDTTNTLRVLLANTSLQLSSATTAEADNMRNLCLVEGEVMSYRDVTLTGAGAYDLGYLRRGAYGSTIASHNSGTRFVRLDGAVFRIPIDPGDIGQTFYFKFVSFNIYGSGVQDLSAVTAYSYTVPANDILPRISSVELISRGNCFVNGNTISKKMSAASGFDSDCYSRGAFSTGSSLSFRASQTNADLYMGLNSDPLTDQNFTSLDFAFKLDASGNWSIWESGSSVVTGTAYTKTTVFEITYDLHNVRYFVDGVLKRQSQVNNASLFFDSSFSTPGATVQDVTFVSNPSAPAVPFIARGTCFATANTAGKYGAGGSWDSDVYSAQTFESGCFVSFVPDQTNQSLMIGLNSDPLTDQSFTSLDFAWFCRNDATLEIYESNVLIGAFGSYTSATALSIKYDGRLVQYFKNGVLQRSIAAANKTLFMDSSWNGAGKVSQLEFGPLTTAPSIPFIARGNCIATATTIRKNGGSGAWDSDTYSTQSYATGCAVSFQAEQTNLQFMIGLNSDPTTDQNFTSLDYAWYCAASGTLQIYESNSLVLDLGASAYTTDTALSIVHDGKFIIYSKDGSVIRRKAAPDVTLFMDSSWNSPGAAARNVQFVPYGAATPSMFIPRGNVVATDRGLLKSGGSAAWDSDAYSLIGFQSCHVQFKASQTSGSFMVGLNTDPTTDQGFTSLDYAWHADSSGQARIYESGSLISSPATYTTTSLFGITYDGSNVKYYLDGVLHRTVAVSGLTLFMDSSFNAVGCSCNGLEFGPGDVLTLVDTQQIGPDAATEVLTITDATETHVCDDAVPDALQVFAVINVPAQKFDYRALVTVTANVWKSGAADIRALIGASSVSGSLSLGSSGGKLVTASASPGERVMDQFDLAVTAGNNRFFTLFANNESTPASTVDMRNITLKVELIKK